MSSTVFLLNFQAQRIPSSIENLESCHINHQTMNADDELNLNCLSDDRLEPVREYLKLVQCKCDELAQRKDKMAAEIENCKVYS